MDVLDFSNNHIDVKVRLDTNGDGGVLRGFMVI